MFPKPERVISNSGGNSKLTNPCVHKGRRPFEFSVGAGRLKAILFAFGLGMSAICGSAAAQTSAKCTNIDQLGATQLKVTQQFARATVEIAQPGGAGRRVEIDYGDEAFFGTIGKDGKAQISFGLTAATNAFDIQLSEMPAVRCKIDVPEFTKVFRVILRWHDPIQLDLHVIEPEGLLGGPGDIGPNQPRGFGQMDMIGRPPTEGGTAETSYVVPDGSTLAPDRVFEFRVEYVTRGMKPALPYCDDGAMASAQMELIIIDRGVATSTNVGTNRLRCGVAVPENRRFMVLQH